MAELLKQLGEDMNDIICQKIVERQNSLLQICFVDSFYGLRSVNMDKYVNFINELPEIEFDMYISTIKVIENITTYGPCPDLGPRCFCGEWVYGHFNDDPEISREVFMDKGEYIEYIRNYSRKNNMDIGVLLYHKTESKNKLALEACENFIEEISNSECESCVYTNYRIFLDNFIYLRS